MTPTDMFSARRSDFLGLRRSLLLCACVALTTAVSSSYAHAQGSPNAAPASASAGQPAGAQPAGAPTTTTALAWGPPSDGMASAASGGSYALLSRLQEENVLLDQQLKIAQKRKALEALSAPASAAPATEAPTSALSDLASMGGDPRVLLVQGHPGAARAMISLPGGGTVLAGVGDIVPQVGTIMSITANTVMVRTASNKVLAVPFWSSLENTVQPSNSGSGVNAIPPPIPARAPTSLAPQPGSSAQ